MSRVEKYRKHREGEGNKIVESEIVNIEHSYEVNPMANQINLEAKRKKSYDNSINSVNLTNLKSNQPSNQEGINKKNELFDIEVAFKNIERKRKEGSVDSDTQAQIISELFSKDFKKYQGIAFEKDKDTQKILISEVELMKLLEKREKNNIRENKFQNIFSKFFIKEDKIIVEDDETNYNSATNIIEDDIVEDMIKEETIEEVKENSVQKISDYDEKKLENSSMLNDFDDKDYYEEKSNKLLITILIILVISFIGLIFMFFR